MMDNNNNNPCSHSTEYRGGVIWFTGLSGAGKTTLATSIEIEIKKWGRQVLSLDGDKLREGLNKDLGFSDEDRRENIRRTTEVAHLVAESGLIVIVACISPFATDRQAARARIGAGHFVEIFVDAPIETCRARDTKGLYAKVDQGLLRNFTGIDSPYECPEHPELHLQTNLLSREDATARIVERLQSFYWTRC